MRLSGFSLHTSLAVRDSLLEGKSKFQAEMDRLQRMLKAAAENGPVLFIIDELFSGTNSRDRRMASEAVLRTLMARGAVGALSTHDLGLTEIADVPELGDAHGIAGRIGSDGFRLCLETWRHARKQRVGYCAIGRCAILLLNGRFS